MTAHEQDTDPEKGNSISQTAVKTPSEVGGISLNVKEKDLENSNIIEDLPSDPNTAENCLVREEESEDPNVVGWDGPNDHHNPLNWPSWRRWTIISTSSFVTFIAGLSSAMFAPGVPALMAEFHSTNSILGSLVVTIFVLGFATGPLVFGPFSELYGRTWVHHVGCLGFLIFSVACALSTSLNMLIGMRLLQGAFASSQLTNGGSIIADTIHQRERGFAMSMFTLGTLFGPVIGPVCGSFLAAAKGWRWVFWIISILLGPMFFLGLVCWKESYAPVLLARKAARLRKETGNMALRSKYDIGLSSSEHFTRGIFRPLKMVAFSPILAAMCLHMGIAYSYLYLLFTTFTQIFEDNYQFSTKIVGLSYLGVGIGFISGQIIFAKLGDTILLKLAKKHRGEMKPEYRLPLGCIGGVFIPIGFFWYGWTAQAKVFWIVPILGTALAGLGNSLVFVSIQAYTIDAFTLYAASALAANTVTRSVMGAMLPLAAPKMYSSLGLGWGNSLLAFLALAMFPVPVLLFIHGEKMRGWNIDKLKKL